MSARFVPFYPDPVKGQAILNNFTRTLRYYGSEAVKTSLRRGMPLYEVQTRERVGSSANAKAPKTSSFAASAFPPART